VFTRREVKELAISAVVIAFVFAYNITGGIPTLNLLFISLIAVSTGFVFHELAHKVTAQRFGCWAEYRMWELGLIGALFLVVVTGWLFIAPGAVYIIPGYFGISRREDGIISASGAIANITLATIFLLIGFKFGAAINAWLALFNMIPFPPLDGSKVIRWNFAVWGTIVAVALLLLSISY
jgi:Zn-dependent protease